VRKQPGGRNIFVCMQIKRPGTIKDRFYHDRTCRTLVWSRAWQLRGLVAAANRPNPFISRHEYHLAGTILAEEIRRLLIAARVAGKNLRQPDWILI